MTAATDLLDINDIVLDEIGEMLKALSDKSRLKIMQALHEGKKTVGQIQDQTGLSQANTSKHLKVLAKARLVKSQKQGTHVIYSVFDPCVNNLCDIVCGTYAQLTEKELRQKL